MGIQYNHQTAAHELVAAYPDFAAHQAGEWLSIMERAERLEVPQRTIMLEHGQACERFMLLVEGSVRVYQLAPDGREVTYYRICSGDVCMMSLSSLVRKRPFMATAATETDVTLYSLSQAQFHRAMQASEIFRSVVLSRMSDRFFDIMQLVQDNVFHNLDMRLACLLGHMFERNQGPVLSITHEAIAHELGTTREVISRLLKEFERKGCIALARGKIRLASEEGLRWFSDA